MASLGNAYRISLAVKVSDTRCEWARPETGAEKLAIFVGLKKKVLSHE